MITSKLLYLSVLTTFCFLSGAFLPAQVLGQKKEGNKMEIKQEKFGINEAKLF